MDAGIAVSCIGVGGLIYTRGYRKLIVWLYFFGCMAVEWPVTTFLHEYAKKNYNCHLFAFDYRVIFMLMTLFIILLCIINHLINKLINIKSKASFRDIIFICLCLPLQMFISTLIILSFKTTY